MFRERVLWRQSVIDATCALMVNRIFVKANPNLVCGFVRATINGFQEAAKHPAAAVKSLVKHNPTANEVLELERLHLALRAIIITPGAQKNGIGRDGVARLASSIAASSRGQRRTCWQPSPTSCW